MRAASTLLIVIFLLSCSGQSDRDLSAPVTEEEMVGKRVRSAYFDVLMASASATVCEKRFSKDDLRSVSAARAKVKSSVRRLLEEGHFADLRGAVVDVASLPPRLQVYCDDPGQSAVRFRQSASRLQALTSA